MMISVLYRDVLNFTNDVFTFNTERKKENSSLPIRDSVSLLCSRTLERADRSLLLQGLILVWASVRRTGFQITRPPCQPVHAHIQGIHMALSNILAMILGDMLALTLCLPVPLAVSC